MRRWITFSRISVDLRRLMICSEWPTIVNMISIHDSTAKFSWPFLAFRQVYLVTFARKSRNERVLRRWGAWRVTSHARSLTSTSTIIASHIQVTHTNLSVVPHIRYKYRTDRYSRKSIYDNTALSSTPAEISFKISTIRNHRTVQSFIYTGKPVRFPR